MKLFSFLCHIGLASYAGFIGRWLWDEVRGLDTSWRHY